MPTPRAHGGAQLVPINLTTPAFSGLNTEQEGSILGVEWATILNNAVFDSSGRPSARKGWLALTTVAASEQIERIFEYYKADGTSEVISSTDTKIYRGTTTLTDITGTLTMASSSVTDGNVKFANFNDKLIAFGVGTSGNPAVYTGTSFASITVNSGTAPTSGIGCSAFGRLWGVDTDGKTLRYSSLLDETRWATDGSGDGGSFDFSKVWPAGQDKIVAVTEFGGDLVVFGKNNIVVLTDGQGSALGIDPLALYVSDTIPGLGALSQFAMCRATGDFWFLSNSGIVGLRRELVQRSTPINNISRNVQGRVDLWANQEDNADELTMEYDLQNDFVVCVFPTAGRQMVFDTRLSTPVAGQSGAGYRATSWQSDVKTVAYIRETEDLLGARTDSNKIFEYDGTEDNGTTFTFEYNSGWLDLGVESSQYLKFVKYITSFVRITSNVDVIHKVAYDFGLREYTQAKTAQGSSVSEFGIAEFGSNGSRDPGNPDLTPGVDVSEFAGSASLRTMRAPGRGSGQFIKVGLQLDTNSGEFAVQQINLYAKIGRMAV